MSLLLTALEINQKPDFTAARRFIRRTPIAVLRGHIFGLLEELTGALVAINARDLRARLREVVQDAERAWTGRSPFGWSTTLSTSDLLIMGGSVGDDGAATMFNSGELFRHSGAAAAAGFRFANPVCPVAEHRPVADQTT